MNCCRRSKFAYDTFRNFSTKLVCRNSVHPPAPRKARITSNSSSLFYSQYKSSGVLFRSNQVYSKLENLSRIKQNQSSLHSVFTRRYYYVDRHQIHHFKPRGYYREFLEDPTNMLIVAGSCALILITTAIYFGKSEVVPYTNRKHFVLLPRRLEERIAKYQFNQMQKSFRGKILPPTHPQSVRVRQIVTNINDALQRHEKLNWEVVVVDEPGNVNAYCFPDGKIVVFTGLLEHFKNDAEIATIVGHEVGHAVARHFAEKITKTMSLAVLPLLLCHYVMPDFIYHYYRDRLSSLLFNRPFSQKMEIEADYIGLLLMASAGYDPRVAPQVYEKLEKVARDTTLRDYNSVHPSGEKRARILRQALVMEEARSLYHEAVAGHVGVEGFEINMFPCLPQYNNTSTDSSFSSWESEC